MIKIRQGYLLLTLLLNIKLDVLVRAVKKKEGFNSGKKGVKLPPLKDDIPFMQKILRNVHVHAHTH